MVEIRSCALFNLHAVECLLAALGEKIHGGRLAGPVVLAAAPRPVEVVVEAVAGVVRVAALARA